MPSVALAWPVIFIVNLPDVKMDFESFMCEQLLRHIYPKSKHVTHGWGSPGRVGCESSVMGKCLPILNSTGRIVGISDAERVGDSVRGHFSGCRLYVNLPVTVSLVCRLCLN
jgi:hypothetical protein